LPCRHRGNLHGDLRNLPRKRTPVAVLLIDRNGTENKASEHQHSIKTSASKINEFSGHPGIRIWPVWFRSEALVTISVSQSACRKISIG
jgi:hypothetical protein